MSLSASFYAAISELSSEQLATMGNLLDIAESLARSDAEDSLSKSIGSLSSSQEGHVAAYKQGRFDSVRELAVAIFQERMKRN